MERERLLEQPLRERAGLLACRAFQEIWPLGFDAAAWIVQMVLTPAYPALQLTAKCREDRTTVLHPTFIMTSCFPPAVRDMGQPGNIYDFKDDFGNHGGKVGLMEGLSPHFHCIQKLGPKRSSLMLFVV